jgi:hypothetical protein
MNPWGILTSMDFWLGYGIGFFLATIIHIINDYMTNPDIGILIRTKKPLNEVVEKVGQALKKLTNAVPREDEGDVIVYHPMINHTNEVHVYACYDNEYNCVFIMGREKRRIARVLRRALQS